MEENLRKRFKGSAVQDDVAAAVEGDISNVTPIKISKNGKQYFNAVLQISNEEFHAVVSFKMQLHAHFLHFAQGQQAVKLCNIRKTSSKYFLNNSTLNAMIFVLPENVKKD